MYIIVSSFFAQPPVCGIIIIIIIQQIRLCPPKRTCEELSGCPTYQQKRQDIRSTQFEHIGKVEQYQEGEILGFSFICYRIGTGCPSAFTLGWSLEEALEEASHVPRDLSTVSQGSGQSSLQNTTRFQIDLPLDCNETASLPFPDQCPRLASSAGRSELRPLPPVLPLLRRRASRHPGQPASRQPDLLVLQRQVLRRPQVPSQRPQVPSRRPQGPLQRLQEPLQQLVLQQLQVPSRRPQVPSQRLQGPLQRRELVLQQPQGPWQGRELVLRQPQGPWRQPQEPSQRRELVALGVVSVEHLQPAGREVLQPPVGVERQPQEVLLPQGQLQGVPPQPPRVVLDRAELEVQPP